MIATESSICISIVSHGQANLIAELERSLAQYCQDVNITLIITKNIPENFNPSILDATFPYTIIENIKPKGYGENHNHAFFNSCTADFFCVLNPDIIFTSNPFPALLSILKDQSIGLVAPALNNSDGQLQDSARKFPTMRRILFRRVLKKLDSFTLSNQSIIYPDWVAGMFMLFPSLVFDQIKGFDERYFMYCEDIDLCFRLKKQKLKTAYHPMSRVVHNPRRRSHRDPQHLKWHIASLCRFMLQKP